MSPVDDKADPVAVVARDTPCKFKLQQGCQHRCRRALHQAITSSMSVVSGPSA